MTKLDLGKQVGPLPLGAWMAVVAGGLGIALWSRKQGSEGPEIVEDTSGDPGVGEGAGTPGFIPVNPPANPSDGPVSYDTNEAWGRAAISWLIAQGYPAGPSNNAVTKALAGGVDIEGNKMSIQEWSLWSVVLAKFGAPPYPVTVSPPVSVPGPVTPPQPPVVTKPPVVKPQPTTPGSGQRIPPHVAVVAKRGDTISKIAARYHKDWRTVWNFNLKYRNQATIMLLRSRGPNLIFAGTTIWVPK